MALESLCSGLSAATPETVIAVAKQLIAAERDAPAPLVRFWGRSAGPQCQGAAAIGASPSPGTARSGVAEEVSPLMARSVPSRVRMACAPLATCLARLRQMKGKRFDGGAWQDESGRGAPCQTDRSEDQQASPAETFGELCPFVALIARRA
jgi:hypothetical protein